MYYTPPHLSKTHFPPPSTSSIFFRDLIYNVKKETKGKRNTLTLLYCLAALVRWLNEWHPPGPIRSLKKKMKIGSGAMCSPRWLSVCVVSLRVPFVHWLKRFHQKFRCLLYLMVAWKVGEEGRMSLSDDKAPSKEIMMGERVFSSLLIDWISTWKPFVSLHSYLTQASRPLE